ATLPPAVVAQDVKPGGDETITIRGIVGVSMFMQDANFGLGNGQKAQFVTDDIEEDAWWHGGDARNVRLTLGFNGPEVLGDWRWAGAQEGGGRVRVRAVQYEEGRGS